MRQRTPTTWYDQGLDVNIWSDGGPLEDVFRGDLWLRMTRYRYLDDTSIKENLKTALQDV